MPRSFNESSGLVPRNFDGLSYEEREALKGEGWKLYESGNSVEEKASGVLQVIQAHFHRSKESAVIQKRKHPEFEEYVSHWLWSDDRLIAGEVRTYLVSKFPLPKKPRIEKGKSYWH